MHKTTHTLKSWPEVFRLIVEGRPFDIRKNDRNYRVGDVLVLREYEPNNTSYSGRECRRTISHIMDGIGPGGITPVHGLARGYAILAFAPGSTS